MDMLVSDKTQVLSALGLALMMVTTVEAAGDDSVEPMMLLVE